MQIQSFVLELEVAQDLAFQVPPVQHRLLLRLHSAAEIELALLKRS